MSITLSELRRPGQQGDAAPVLIPGNVAHFGSSPPEGKHCVRIVGEDVAAHHAKLFFSQEQFWLVNLSGLPCSVLKASGRTVFLTVTEPTCELEVGESFRIGSHMFYVRDLSPPLRKSPRAAARADRATTTRLERLHIPLDPQMGAHPEDPLLWETALGFSSNLLRYQQQDEMWRHAADAVGSSFHRRWDHLSPTALVGAATWERRRTGDASSEPTTETAVNIEPLSLREATGTTEWHDALGVPAKLLAGVHRLILERARPFLCPWIREESPAFVNVVSFPVTCADEVVGGLCVLARWPSERSFYPGPDDLYLLNHLAKSLGLSLTFLEQRLKALNFQRVHDIGSAVEDSLHDQAHLIQLVDHPLEELSRMFSRGRGPRAKDGQREVSKVRTIARQVRGVARSTLDFARHDRTDASSEAHGMEDCRLALNELFDLLRWIIHDSFVAVTAKSLPESCSFVADIGAVMAALRNLLTNAQSALRGRGEAAGPPEIRLCAEVRTLPAAESPSIPLPFVVLSVMDSGTGIPSRIRGLVFRERISDSRSGHGLGSRIVRRVMDQHRGVIHFSSAEGVGTVVELWFPHLRSVSPAESARSEWPPFEALRKALGHVQDLGEDYITQLLERSRAERSRAMKRKGSQDHGRHARGEPGHHA